MRVIHLIGFVVSCTLQAQTYVIDDTPGPGVDFPSIVTAIAGAPSGSILEVRPGYYHSFVVDQKSITILCDTGVAIYPSVTVQNLTAQQQFTMRGGIFFGSFTTGDLELRNCAGTVLIDSLFAGNVDQPLTNGGLIVQSCADVRIRNSKFNHFTAPYESWSHAIVDSRVTLSNCNLRRGRNPVPPYGLTNGITNSTVEFVDSHIRSNYTGGPETSPLYVLNSNVRLMGASSIAYGQQGTHPIIGGNGNVRLDPSVTLSAFSPVMSFGPLINVDHRSMPTLAAYPGALGQHASAQLTGPANSAGILFAGLPGLPTVVAPNLDLLMIQSGTAVVMAGGVLTPQISSHYSVPLSAQGIRITWQGVSLDPVYGPQLSNSSTYVH